MNKNQKQGELAKLQDEEKVLKKLKRQYEEAGKTVAKKIKLADGKINALLENYDSLSDMEKSKLQSQIYQKQFQESLKKQIDSIVDNMNVNQHKTIDNYLKSSYETGFLATMYDIHGQGIPIIMPIDQKQVAEAVKLDPKLSKKLYGSYMTHMKTHVRNEISRGIATADSFANIARNISNRTQQGFNRTMRIVRTEGHRIQVSAANDAQHKAKDAGADIVKQWDAALDGRTRPLHRQLDGQIRELDEPFEIGGIEVMHPSAFGRPDQDINCRCALLQRAKWALDEDELLTLKERAEFFGLDKTKDFNDFAEKYNIAIEQMQNMQGFDITAGGRYKKLTYKTEKSYAEYIKPEYDAQHVTVKERNILWRSDGGYIQNGQGYQDINGYMRGLQKKLYNPKCKETINVLKKLTSSNTLTKDYIGIRKVNADYLKDVMGIDITGMFAWKTQINAQGRRRTERCPVNKNAAQSIADKINALVGTEKGKIVDSAVTSVSLSENLNYFTHYPIKFEIQMPKGTKGLITSNYMESEFIAKANTVLELIGAEVYNDGNKYVIKVNARMVQQ